MDALGIEIIMLKNEGMKRFFQTHSNFDYANDDDAKDLKN